MHKFSYQFVSFFQFHSNFEQLHRNEYLCLFFWTPIIYLYLQPFGRAFTQYASCPVRMIFKTDFAKWWAISGTNDYAQWKPWTPLPMVSALKQDYLLQPRAVLRSSLVQPKAEPVGFILKDKPWERWSSRSWVSSETDPYIWVCGNLHQQQSGKNHMGSLETPGNIMDCAGELRHGAVAVGYSAPLRLTAGHSLSVHEMDLQFQDPKFTEGSNNNYLLLGTAACGES